MNVAKGITHLPCEKSVSPARAQVLLVRVRRELCPSSRETRGVARVRRPLPWQARLVGESCELEKEGQSLCCAVRRALVRRQRSTCSETQRHRQDKQAQRQHEEERQSACSSSSRALVRTNSGTAALSCGDEHRQVPSSSSTSPSSPTVVRIKDDTWRARKSLQGIERSYRET